MIYWIREAAGWLLVQEPKPKGAGGTFGGAIPSGCRKVSSLLRSEPAKQRWC